MGEVCPNAEKLLKLYNLFRFFMKSVVICRIKKHHFYEILYQNDIQNLQPSPPKIIDSTI